MFEEISRVLANLFSVTLSVAIVRTYFKTFLLEKDLKLYQITIWGIYFVGQIIQGHITIAVQTNIVISLLLVFAISLINYSGKILQRAMYSVLIVVIWVFAEFAVAYAFTLCGLNFMVPQLIGSVLSKVITFGFVIFLRVFFKNEYIPSMPSMFNLFFLLIPIGSLYLIYNNFMFSINNREFILEGIISSLIVVAVNVLVYSLILSVTKEKELQRHNTAYVQHLEQCNQHMKEKESIMKEFRDARHDMKHHFAVMLELLEKNRNEEARAYLQKVIQINPIDSAYISRTDNIFVDSLVNAKYVYMKQNGIEFIHDIHIPVIMPYDSADVCVMLGNMLDNAIEAAAKMPEGQRRVEFYLRFEKGILHLTVRNTFNGEIRKNKDGVLLTGKQEPWNHGVGLNSVRKVAEKYNGSVVIDAKTQFVIKAVLFARKNDLQPQENDMQS